MISIFLHKSPFCGGITFKHAINIKQSNGMLVTNFWKNRTRLRGAMTSWGYSNYIRRSVLVDPSNNILSNGTLRIALDLIPKEKTASPFVPANSCAKKMQSLWYQDPKHTDVSFVFPEECSGVSNYDEESDNDSEVGDGSDAQAVEEVTDNDAASAGAADSAQRNGFKDDHKKDIYGDGGHSKVGNKDCGNVQAQKYYAHRAVLQACAPGLFELCEPFDKETPVPLSNVKPRIFEVMLMYIYGMSVSTLCWQNHSRELLDAADRYGVSDLKLEAEAWFVNSTPITADNVIDLLNYADAKNCALLKEKVMEYFVENRKEALKLVSFNGIPVSQSLFTDLLLAMNAGSGDSDEDTDSEEIKVMRISSLRRKLWRMGLEVDGSREALIERIEDWKRTNGTAYNKCTCHNAGKYLSPWPDSEDSSSSSESDESESDVSS
ncbi:hypothetical protein ACHAWF_008358 [Thalassiosira exigua]